MRTPPFRGLTLAMLSLSLLCLAILSLGLGRFPVPPLTVLDVLGHALHLTSDPANETQQLVVLQLRLPRVIGATVAGMALGMAGAALQGVFRNPLVDAHIIGISSGASFGGALAMLSGLSMAGIVSGAFGFGLTALAVVFLLNQAADRMTIMALVLAGLIVGAFFSALVSLVVFIADPELQLPGIVYWLMGSFSRLNQNTLWWLLFPVFAAAVPLYRMRWRINLLSLGDREAESLGVRVNPTRWALLSLVSLMVGAQVAVSGGIGWIGLMVPHLGRMLCGPDHRVLLPVSALVGGLFTLAMDTFARSVTAQELPIGLLSALIGAPLFAVLFWRRRNHWISGDGA